MLIQALRKLFGATPARNTAAQQPKTMSIYEYADSCGDVVAGYRLCVTMQPWVPLRYLRRHQEFSKTLPAGEANAVSPFYIWLPETDSKYDFLAAGSTMSSSVGPIPDDGGTFLPFLIAVRNIVERPRDSSISDYQDAIVRTNKILALRMTDSRQYVNKLFGSSKEQVLGFTIGEVSKVGYTGLKLEHLDELFRQSYLSISEMVGADDSILLALKGIGPNCLAKIHTNIKQSEQDAPYICQEPPCLPNFMIPTTSTPRSTLSPGPRGEWARC